MFSLHRTDYKVISHPHKLFQQKASYGPIEKYQEVQQYLLGRDWVGLKWRPVVKVWEQLQDKPSKVMQNSYT